MPGPGRAGAANETPPFRAGAANPGATGGPRQRVSLTGAVSSQKVTEEREGRLRLVDNQPSRTHGQKPA